MKKIEDFFKMKEQNGFNPEIKLLALFCFDLKLKINCI